MAQERSYQWMVRRGRIGMVLHADDAEVELEIDPERSNFCVLDLRDATEITAILTQFAGALWERFQLQQELHGTAKAYVIDESSPAMTWQTAAGRLQVELNANREHIRFGGSETMRVRLR